MSDTAAINSESIGAIVSAALTEIAGAQDLAALKAIRNTAVGEQSDIAKLNAELKNIAHDQKAAAGALIGAVMKATGGQADAAKVRELLLKHLGQ